MYDYYITVARERVLRSEAKCCQCNKPFTKDNVFTVDGNREIAITGLCEKCFDENFEEQGK